MHINFECTGGFANLQLRYRTETDALPQKIAADLLTLIKDSGVLSLQQKESAQDPGLPDVFHYKLTLDDGLKSKSIELNDISAPPSLHPLLARLRELALEQKRNN